MRKVVEVDGGDVGEDFHVTQGILRDADDSAPRRCVQLTSHEPERMTMTLCPWRKMAASDETHAGRALISDRPSLLVREHIASKRGVDVARTRSKRDELGLPNTFRQRGLVSHSPLVSNS